MYSVIRNGDYLFTDNILLGDIQVQQKPHENAVFLNGTWIIDVDSYFASLDFEEAKETLNSTDWQILRHKEQVDLGIETTLSEEEYLQLITKRQEAREKVQNDSTIK